MEGPQGFWGVPDLWDGASGVVTACRGGSQGWKGLQRGGSRKISRSRRGWGSPGKFWGVQEGLKGFRRGLGYPGNFSGGPGGFEGFQEGLGVSRKVLGGPCSMRWGCFGVVTPREFGGISRKISGGPGGIRGAQEEFGGPGRTWRGSCSVELEWGVPGFFLGGP